jgi:N-acetylglucosaminyldiphosphoundecaprenol N-acetyl-beta-D-mannosaminyltransferase
VAVIFPKGFLITTNSKTRWANLRKRLKILDIWVDPVDHKQAINCVSGFLGGQKPCCIFSVNPEKNFSVPKDPELYEVFKNAELLIPDGIGIVLAARLLHGVTLNRLPGVDFMKQICSLAEQESKSVFLYGAREAVNEAAAKRLQFEFPKLHIAGRSSGYVPESQMAELIRKINDSGASVLFLALGSPRQEKWFASHAADLKTVRVCQGIGGTLDTIAGTVKRAPAIWQHFSLEWLYRLLSEPKRIGRQKVLPIFILRVLLAMAKSNH